MNGMSSSLETLVELKGKGTCKHSSAKTEPYTRRRKREELMEKGSGEQGEEAKRKAT